MKIVRITGKQEADLFEVATPKANGEYAVVKLTVVPMCTEYKAYRDGHKSSALGHEAAGEVVEVGRQGRLKTGDRIVLMPGAWCGRCPYCETGDYIHCQRPPNVEKVTGNATGQATYAQYGLKQDWLCLPVPDGMSIEHASMTCCGLGPTFGAMQRMKVDRFDTVLISGLGPVGLGGVINASYRGARVIGVESFPYRAKLAKELGAVEVFDPTDKDVLKKIRDFTGGAGADKAVDCSGAAPAQRLLIDAVRRRGQVSFVGEGGELTIRVSDDMIRKGIALHGVWHWNLADAPRILKTIAESGSKIDKLITHRFPMSRVKEAFALQTEGKCGKALLDPWA